MNKWTALAVCAVAAAAVGIFAIWALAVRDESTDTAPKFNDSAYRIERCHDQGGHVEEGGTDSPLVLFCVRKGSVLGETTFDADVIDAWTP